MTRFKVDLTYHTPIGYDRTSVIVEGVDDVEKVPDKALEIVGENVVLESDYKEIHSIEPLP